VFLLNFYRAIIAVLCGAIVFFIFLHKWWIWVCVFLLTRVVWFFIEQKISHIKIDKLFTRCETEFKQLYGPYGIRLVNKAETDWQIRKSLAEVFEDNKNKLKNTVEQLEVMNTLFQAGLKPDEDTYLLHDLKLKYGKYRLEKMRSS
jgi:hypothetical protein